MLMAMRSLNPSSQGDRAVSFLLKCYLPYFHIIVDDAGLDDPLHPGLSSTSFCGLGMPKTLVHLRSVSSSPFLVSSSPSCQDCSTCIRAYIYIKTYTYTEAYIHTYIHAYIHTYLHACMHTYIIIHIHILIHIHIHIHRHVHTHTYMYTYTNACACAYTYAHAHAHAHT